MIPFLCLMLGVLAGIIIGAAFASDIGAHRVGRIRTIGDWQALPVAHIHIATAWRRR